MKPDGACAVDGRDLSSGCKGLLIWGIPIVLLGVSAGLGGVYPVFAWPPLLAFMGGVCLLNARRCGRRHCYYTGPYFLILALLSLLYGLGLLPLGPKGWQWLSSALAIGACILWCVPEWLSGRYVTRR
ncbi:MAG TPA: hypothetical protein VGV16_07740 [Gammaproteobacteria bacterium]|nr:hypothetical protein [Gammaproteobacteria bacterium]